MNRINRRLLRKYSLFCAALSIFFIVSVSRSVKAQVVSYVPQVIDGENAPDDQAHFFRTEFFFVNNSAESSVDVVLTLASDVGDVFPRLIDPTSGPPAAPRSSINFTVPPGGSSLVRTSNGAFPIVGYATIEATGQLSILATLQYVESGTSEIVTSTSLLPDAPVTSFSTVALVNFAGASIGLAALNMSNTEIAEVTVRLYRSSGEFFDERTITLQPWEKISQFLDQEGVFVSLIDFIGTVEVESTQPISAVAIRVDNTHWSTFRLFPKPLRD